MNNDNFLANLAIMANIFQVANYSENLTQTSNDEIMKSLELQNTKYLEKIVTQNEEIIALLKQLRRE